MLKEFDEQVLGGFFSDGVFGSFLGCFSFLMACGLTGLAISLAVLSGFWQWLLLLLLNIPLGILFFIGTSLRKK